VLLIQYLALDYEKYLNLWRSTSRKVFSDFRAILTVSIWRQKKEEV